MQISITQQCPSVHDETLISVHGTAGNGVLVQNESYIHCTNISEKLYSQGGKTQADVKCGTKLMETLCFFAPDAENVGQEDPTVWIGYMCMIAISFFHSRISSCGNFFPE